MKTIEDIRNKKVAINNDGTLEELKEVLGVAFPEGELIVRGYYKYYFAQSISQNKWDCTDEKPKFPIQTVKDFIKQIRDREMKNKEQEYELVDFKIEDLKEGSILMNGNKKYEVQGTVGKIVFISTDSVETYTLHIDHVKNKDFKLKAPKPKLEKIQGFEVRYYPELPLVEVSEYEDFRFGSCNIAQLIKVTENGSFVTSLSGLWKYCRPVPKERRNFIDIEEK